MTSRVVDWNRQRWLSLANLALQVAGAPSNTARAGLMTAAGRMVSATPPSSDPHAMSLCLAFRWCCTAYAASPVDRASRGATLEGLTALARAVRMLFDHDPAPQAAVMAMPVPAAKVPTDLGEQAWQRRADIGGA